VTGKLTFGILESPVPNSFCFLSSDAVRPSRSYSVLIAKRTTKKHKTWEQDGVMTIDGNLVSITVGETTKSNPKFKLPAELIPGETEFVWEGKLVLVRNSILEHSW